MLAGGTPFHPRPQLLPFRRRHFSSFRMQVQPPYPTAVPKKSRPKSDIPLNPKNSFAVFSAHYSPLPMHNGIAGHSSLTPGRARVCLRAWRNSRSETWADASQMGRNSAKNNSSVRCTAVPHNQLAKNKSVSEGTPYSRTAAVSEITPKITRFLPLGAEFYPNTPLNRRRERFQLVGRRIGLSVRDRRRRFSIPHRQLHRV
jgi:hypothetical protein